jgi:hypothetical protein
MADSCKCKKENNIRKLVYGHPEITGLLKINIS